MHAHMYKKATRQCGLNFVHFNGFWSSLYQTNVERSSKSDGVFSVSCQHPVWPLSMKKYWHTITLGDDAPKIVRNAMKTSENWHHWGWYNIILQSVKWINMSKCGSMNHS